VALAKFSVLSARPLSTQGRGIEVVSLANRRWQVPREVGCGVILQNLKSFHSSSNNAFRHHFVRLGGDNYWIHPIHGTVKPQLSHCPRNHSTLIACLATSHTLLLTLSFAECSPNPPHEAVCHVAIGAFPPRPQEHKGVGWRC